MKKILSIILVVFVIAACQDQLDVVNKNEPTPQALNSENGIIQFGAGIYNDMLFPDNNFDFTWIAQAAHEAMGDAIYIPWGNFGWRWVNQVSSITLDNGTVITPPEEADQAASLKRRNTRDQTTSNIFNHEWTTMYFVNNSANLVLEKLEEGIVFSGDQATKEGVITAWAHWWKGYAYSRLGSMFVAGLILDESGTTNGNYVDNQALLAEATEHFDLAIQQLNALSANEDYTSILQGLIPQIYRPSGVPTPAEWVRNINTMKARNLLVNKKDADKTSEDWNAIRTLAEAGMQSGDFNFCVYIDGNNFNTSTTVPYRLLVGWHWVSERLVQDIQPGDDRLDDEISLLSTPQVNRSGRGIQFGTRYNFVEGTIASTARGGAPTWIGPSYEENELMIGEALINTGQIENGLGYIDDVRTFQGSSLDAVSGAGLTLAEAKEQLRSERRIGLLLRGVPFYDARRWGVIDPISEGGGRTGCVVLDANGNLNTNATFDYKYMDYWDVPANELDFNANTGSVPVVENAK